MQISKTFLVAGAATLLLAFLCRADDSAATNPTAVADSKTNVTTSAQSKPVSKADQKKAEKAAKKQAEADAKAKKDTAAKPPSTVKNAPVLQPIIAPPLPLSADKQKRLADLLQQYKGDKVTPEEYHIQRAKILAEP